MSTFLIGVAANRSSITELRRPIDTKITCVPQQTIDDYVHFALFSIYFLHYVSCAGAYSYLPDFYLKVYRVLDRSYARLWKTGREYRVSNERARWWKFSGKLFILSCSNTFCTKLPFLWWFIIAKHRVNFLDLMRAALLIQAQCRHLRILQWHRSML